MPERSPAPTARVYSALLMVSLATAGIAASRNAWCEQPPGQSVAPSDEARAEQRRAQAKLKYEQGADAYLAGHYKDAVGLFLAADELAPSAPLSFNIARAEEKLGDTAATLRWYRDYLRRSPGAPNEGEVRAAVAALSTTLAKKGVQQLTVLTNPEGASVQIDDRPAVVTPWTGELKPGKHHLSIARTGYIDSQRDVRLSSSEALDVSVQLEQTPAAPVAPSAPPPEASAPQTPTQTAPIRGPRLGALPWVTLGAGAAALGGALTFELLRRSAEKDAEHATQLDYQAQADREHSRQTTARVFLGAGAAFAVAGGVMLLIDNKAPHSTAGSGSRVGFFCVPQTCAAAASGRF